ncbi:NAD(P)-dependent oxidoreductase [Patescibacteria group bacterium AH-259-L05]|nr:NAD(P)-dependent oxidoreductase [Patescibacteria group bacterium AH-259-L05]
MSKTLVITGASGFVGSHALDFALTNELSSYGYVIATDIRELGYVPEYKDKHFTFVKADFTNADDMTAILRELRQKPYSEIVVWHMGAIFNYTIPRRLIYDVNVLGTEHLLEALTTFDDIRQRIRRFVFWSGGVLYGDFNDPHVSLPATEEYPVNPTNDYGWSKKEGEDRVLFFHKKFGIPVTIMRLAAIYGPRSRYGMAVAYSLMAKGQLVPFIIGDGTNHGALIHAEDVVRVADFLASVDEANGQIYNVVDKTPYTSAELTTFLGRELNNEPFQRLRLPLWIFKLFIKTIDRTAQRVNGEPLVDMELAHMTLADNWMSNKKLIDLAKRHGRENDLLKYPDSLEGLKQTLDWYRKEGWL